MMDDPTISLSGGGWRGKRPPLAQWGPFELQERVGQGGFGEVYRAWDPALQRVVAVKLLHPRAESEEEQTAAVLREARAMARVIHPNIVPIYGVHTYDGRAGFWSAYVRGKTLSALLAANGPFGPREAIHIGVDICRALSAVHAAGLLHRDIKTGNVMREEGGRILLMDFGLTHESDGISNYGGTTGYIAPELLGGANASVRSDIYALGVLIYRLLCEKYPPADGSGGWSLLDQRPDLSPELVRAIHTAIDPDPEKRFASAAQMAAALNEADPEGSSSSAARLAGVTPAAPAPSGILRVRRYAAACIVLLIAATVGYLLRSHWHPGSASSAAHERYEAAHDLVRNYYRPGALAKAIPILQAISRENPSFAPAFADLGRANYLQFTQNRDSAFAEPARKASLAAIAIDANQVSAHVTLGMLYTQLGRNDLAAQELDAAAGVDRTDAEVWGARAELYQHQGRNEDMETALRTAMDLAPTDWRWPRLLADHYYRTGRNDPAIRAAQDALRLAPDNPRILNNLGLYFWSADRLDEARVNLEKAIAIEPDYTRYSNLGGVERDLGDNAAAVALFQKAIELNPNDYRAWNYLADIYQRQRADPAKVRETYLKSISRGDALLKTEPKNTSLLADLGVMSAAVGDMGESVRLIRQAAALDPDSAEILFMTGVAYELMNQRAEALKWIASALRHGYPLKSVEKSPDLALLRTDKRYLAIVAAVR
jgi:serine/threonine protein kinase